MGYVYNPLLGAGLDQTGAGGGGGTPGGSTTQVQFNDAGAFGGDVDLTWNKTTNLLTIGGDVNLNDGGTYTTTLQTITPTANRTISLPNATGTVALVGGSSGQLLWNNAGAVAGASTLTYDGSILTTSGRFINSYNATASSPAKTFTGTWFTGGTSTTTKPQVLVEPTGTTSTAWSTSGTGIGVNAASGFTGNLLDLQVNGSRSFAISRDSSGNHAITVGAYPTFTFNNSVTFNTSGTAAGFTFNSSIICNTYVGSTFGSAVNSSNGSSVTFYGQDIGFGSNLTGGNCVVRGGIGRGSGAGGAVVFQTAPSGTAGATANTAVERARITSDGIISIADTVDISVGTTTGTKIGTATTQKIGFYNKTPVVQPTAVADITTTATAGTLPTPNGAVTIADAATPTNVELLEYCVELEAKLEAALSRLRDLGLIAT